MRVFPLFDWAHGWRGGGRLIVLELCCRHVAQAAAWLLQALSLDMPCSLFPVGRRLLPADEGARLDSALEVGSELASFMEEGAWGDDDSLGSDLDDDNLLVQVWSWVLGAGVGAADCGYGCGCISWLSLARWGRLCAACASALVTAVQRLR